MPPKPNNRNKWNDVQTAIATIAIAATLGMWNLFATPAKTVAAQTAEPEEPTLPPTEPPVPVTPEPKALPQVKIMFTQLAPQTTVVSQPQPQQETKKKKKRKNKDNGGDNGGGGGSDTVTQTQSS